MTRKIMLDTNFLVAPFQLSIDLFDEIDRIYPVNEVYTLEDAIQEARSIEQGRYKNLVDKLIETQDIEVLETEGEGEVDDLLFNICDDFIIATNDRELKERLVKKGAEVLFIRSGSHLEALNRKELGI